jgi:hypothetical protein
MDGMTLSHPTASKRAPIALRRLGEATADLATIGARVADKASNSKSHRLPAKRFRLEGSRVGNSPLVTEDVAHALRREHGGGTVVEVINAHAFYAAHFACEVACPKKSCQQPAGAPCVTNELKATLVHAQRVAAWSVGPVDESLPAAPLKPIDRDCPKCQAPAGAKCRNKWGGSRPAYHPARKADAAAVNAASAAAPVVEAPVAPAVSVGPGLHSPEVKREPQLRVACPTCRSPKFVRCVTRVNKFTKAHAQRTALWAAGEEQGS